MHHIQLKHIDKFYGKNHVLRDLSLEIESGEFMTFLGPSGCGKTTTLRVIAGLERPQNGRILIDGREVTNAEEHLFLPASARGLNLVFQSYALWPHMTVFENVAFGLTLQKTPRSEIEKKVSTALERMRICEYRDRYPAELSGGQQQRVAIARAIVSEPRLLLLDEPLSNLDAKLRLEMRSELKRLHREMGTTMIYVTHDQVEALTLSTRIAVFFDGRIEQLATPSQLYQNPSTLRFADFIGNPKLNFINGTLRRMGEQWAVSSPLGDFTLSADCLTDSTTTECPCVLGIRPEQFSLRRDGAVRHARVTSSMPAGSETLTEVLLGDTPLLIKEMGNGSGCRPGDEVSLTFAPEEINLFRAADGALIKRSALPDTGIHAKANNE